jgi:aminoglycoside 3-N-acetyltransferase
MNKIWTKEEIRAQLYAFAPYRGRVVHVHSSLKAVGEIEGRGEAFLDLLIEYFATGDGLLTIPTHTWGSAGIDLTKSETCVGTLARLAAAHPAATRSEHPSHSMAVFGAPERVAAFVAYDAVATAPAPPEGCYGKLYDLGGYVLLVGVAHNRNTYLHAVDEILGVPNRMSEEARLTVVRRTNGELVSRYLHMHETDYTNDVSLRFPKYEIPFRYHGAIRDGFVGNAPTQLCDARIMKEVMELIFKNSEGKDPLEGETPIPPRLYC